MADARDITAAAAAAAAHSGVGDKRPPHNPASVKPKAPQNVIEKDDDEWLNCKIRCGGTLQTGLGPWQWSCAFP